MAHLPRDGTGCEKDGARRSVRVGSLHAAEGEPGHQPSRDAPITTRTRASIFAPEGFGDVHKLPADPAICGEVNVTGALRWSRYCPSVTTRSPPERPEVTIVRLS